MSTTAKILLLAAGLSAGCSLALDMDALQKGTDTDTDTEPLCTADSECDDGVECTVDECDAEGHCGSTPDNSQCAYLEYCHPENGCIPTGDECKVDSDCDDDVGCTDDTCVIASGGDNYCTNEPDDSYCESDNPCIEGETCSAVTGCIEGTEKECPQTTAPCMESVCNPLNGECEDVYEDGADDDSDTYLDEACGGDDCDDGNADVHPSAQEDCDGVDDDCDGFTDLSIAANASLVAQAAQLGGTALVHDGTNWGVVWQQGSGTSAEVYARFLTPTGLMVSDPHNFTALGGVSTAGGSPDLAFGGGAYRAIWIADDGTDPPRVLLVDLTVDTGTGDVAQGTLVALETGTDVDVFAPTIAYDGETAGSGWVAAWLAESTGGDLSVEMQTSDMHSVPAGTTFEVSAGTGAVSGVDVSVVGANDYIVAYSRATGATDGDLEVFESRVELVGEVWDHASGYPAMISDADSGGDDDSWQPITAVVGAGDWTTAFTDTQIIGLTDTENISVWDGSALSDLVSGDSYRQTDPAWAWDGTRYGLFYLSSVGSAVALEFRQFDDALTMPADPYYGTRFALVSGGSEELEEPALASDGAGGFGALVVHNDGTGDDLLFYTFSGCTPPSK